MTKPAVVRWTVKRALTGHVTEQMQLDYSTVGLDEKRAAIAGVLRLAPVERKAVVDVGVAPRGGTTVVPLEELN